MKWVGATNSGIGSLPNTRPSAAGNILLLSGRAGGLPDRSPVPGPAPGRGPGRSSGRSLDRPPDQPPDQRPAGPPAGPWAGPRAAPRNSPPAGPRTGPRAKSMLPRRWPAGFIGGAPCNAHQPWRGRISKSIARQPWNGYRSWAWKAAAIACAACVPCAAVFPRSDHDPASRV